MVREGVASLRDERSGGGVDGETTIPAAHQVGCFVQLVVGVGRVIDGVGETMAHLLVHFAVDVGLHGEHVGWA